MRCQLTANAVIFLAIENTSKTNISSLMPLGVSGLITSPWAQQMHRVNQLTRRRPTEYLIIHVRYLLLGNVVPTPNAYVSMCTQMTEPTCSYGRARDTTSARKSTVKKWFAILASPKASLPVESRCSAISLEISLCGGVSVATTERHEH